MKSFVNIDPREEASFVPRQREHRPNEIARIEAIETPKNVDGRRGGLRPSWIVEKEGARQENMRCSVSSECTTVNSMATPSSKRRTTRPRIRPSVTGVPIAGLG